MCRKGSIVGVVVLLLFLFSSVGAAGCAEKKAELSPCPISLAYVDKIFVASYSDPGLIAKEPKPNIIAIGITVSNPNSTMVVLNDLSPVLYVDGVLWGVASLPGEIYVPPNKEVKLEFTFSPLTFGLVQQVLLGEGKTVPDAVKRVLGILAAIGKDQAAYEVEGGASFSSEGSTLSQPLDLKWVPQK